MAAIKIICNDIELDYVRETLSVKKENTALSRNFKISHSTVPFLIVENSNTKKAIGTRELTSVNKQKIIDVIVFDSGEKYFGKLQVLSYLNGFRKCNLKYASELLTIMDKKISEFMPVVSVIPGEIDLVAFTDKSDQVIPGYEYWETYPVAFINQGFPAVKWQFPTMVWRNKFGIDLADDDEWAEYKDEVNQFSEDNTVFANNSFTENEFEILTVENNNVPMPQVYLLAPLFYALQSIGFTAEGSFYTSDFIKRILFLSFKNNLTEVVLKKSPVAVVFSGSGSNNYSHTVSIPAAGTYVIAYEFTFAGPLPYYFNVYYSLSYSKIASPFRKTLFRVVRSSETSFVVSGTEEVKYNGAGTLYFNFQTYNEIIPSTYSLTVSKGEEKTFFEMHPTVELGRYLPDWTFATYLNALQNMFNVEILPDDLRKRLTLNLYEEKIASGESYKLKKSLAINSFDEPPFEAFLIKYDNDEDQALWITREGSVNFTDQKSDYSETLATKFKYIPLTYTANLSDDLESKSGVGLIIYNHEDYPYVSDEFSGQSLKLEGVTGIREFFWKKTLKFRLNGSVVEITGPLTEIEINNITRLNRVYVDHQDYIVLDIQQEETIKGNFNVKLHLQTVTF